MPIPLSPYWIAEYDSVKARIPAAVTMSTRLVLRSILLKVRELDLLDRLVGDWTV